MRPTQASASRWIGALLASGAATGCPQAPASSNSPVFSSPAPAPVTSNRSLSEDRLDTLIDQALQAEQRTRR